MTRLYSLVEPPPRAFEYVAAYERGHFHGRPFALHSNTLAEAEAFLGKDLGQLCGVLVSSNDGPTELFEVSPALYHLRIDATRVAVLKDIVEPLVRLLDTRLSDRDQLCSVQLELHRAEQDRARLRAQLTQTRKLESIGRLAGGVAHDFNNMLAVILGRSELALREISRDAPLFEDLEEIRKTAQRSAQLTRQLLAFARRQTIKPATLCLNEAISGMLVMLRRLLGEDIRLDWSPGPSLWMVCFDPGQLDQLLANLAVNARDTIADTGTIAISTRNHSPVVDPADASNVIAADHVVLSVKSDGISAEIMSQGPELGLSTVFGIVEHHHGSMEVLTREDEGTEFLILLPRAKDVTLPDVTREYERAPLGRHETLLIVEDEQAVLSLEEKTLTQLGYQVVAVGSPMDALTLMGKHSLRVDLLLTDVVMPAMNGRELAERLRALQPGLRCLYMSGYSEEVFSSRGVIDDGIHFIQKPFTVAQIALKLREVLDGTASRH